MRTENHFWDISFELGTNQIIRDCLVEYEKCNMWIEWPLTSFEIIICPYIFFAFQFKKKKSKHTVGPLKFFPHCKINEESLLRRKASVVFHPVPWYSSSEGGIDYKRHSLEPLLSWQQAELAAFLSFISAQLSGTSQHMTLSTGRDN